MNDRGLIWISLLFYGMASLLTLRRLRRANVEMISAQHHLNLALMIAGFVLHTVSLVWHGHQIHRCPVTNLAETQLFVAWSAVLFYLLIGTSYRISFLGAFTAPVVLSLGLVSLLGPDTGTAEPLRRNPWVDWHAAIAIMGCGAFALAFVTGAMYLLQERQLRTHRLRPLFHLLPPIDQLDVVGFRLLVMGFGLFTLGMIGGVAANHLGPHWATIKTTWAVAVWMLSGALVAMRGGNIWRGHRFAIGAMVLFLFTMIGFWGANRFSP